MEYLTPGEIREALRADREAADREYWTELEPYARLGDLRRRQWFTHDERQGQVVRLGPGSVAVRFKTSRQIVVGGELKANIKSWRTETWSPETVVLPRTTERRTD
jgi:hypothetical protein